MSRDIIDHRTYTHTRLAHVIEWHRNRIVHMSAHYRCNVCSRYKTVQVTNIQWSNICMNYYVLIDSHIPTDYLNIGLFEHRIFLNIHHAQYLYVSSFYIKSTYTTEHVYDCQFWLRAKHVYYCYILHARTHHKQTRTYISLFWSEPPCESLEYGTRVGALWKNNECGFSSVC